MWNRWMVLILWMLMLPRTVSSFTIYSATISRYQQSCNCLYSSRSSEEEEGEKNVKETIRRLAEEAKLQKYKKKLEEEAESQRMSLVRSIQASYYNSTSIKTEPTTISTAGIVSHLPVWNVHWTELPGRSNVLNIHKPLYVHLFETIIRGPKPWYLGHVEESSTAKVGTLMRIVDYRRIKDGRILLYVQGLERFAVQDLIQEKPTILAHVQILPDLEEIKITGEQKKQQEEELSIRDSFSKWHAYEYDSTIQIPIRNTAKEISLSDIYGPDLQTIMPFATYSKKMIMARTKNDEEFSSDVPKLISSHKNSTVLSKTMNDMIENNILKSPQLHPEIHRITNNSMSNDDLEYQLWIYMDEFVRTQMEAKTKNTHTKNSKNVDKLISFLSPLIMLLPPSTTWPDNFISHQLQTNNNQTLIEEYPNHRRQRRLSYVSSILLEYAGLDNGIRQILLEIPSTRERLM